MAALRIQQRREQSQKSGILYILVYIPTVILAVAAVYVLITAALNFAIEKKDDLQYGKPRSDKVAFNVDNTEAYFISLNMEGQVVLLQVRKDGVDTLQAPYLFGSTKKELIPPILKVEDMDRNGYPDLVLEVKGEKVIYLHRGNGQFSLANDQEIRGMLDAFYSE